MPPLSPPTPHQSSSSTAPSTTKGGRRRRGRVALATVAAVTLALVGASGPAVAHDRHKGHDDDNAFKQVNLVSDIPHLAQLTDDMVKNPWGIDFGPTTPLWVSNQASNTLTLYRGATKATPVAQKVPLIIAANSPTGMLFNPTKKFQVPTKDGMAPANFLMNENVFTQTSATAQVTAWSNAFADTSKTMVKASKANSFYSGLTMLPPTHRRGPRLLVANNVTGKIDIYDGTFRARSFGSMAFKDPKVAALKALPYNVAYLKGRVYVAYAPPFGEPGTPAVTVFDTHGKLIKRLVTGGSLNNPWGMTIAPKHWGKFGGALLVGNVNDGMIHAFNPWTGHLLGTLKDQKGKPLVNIGLWGLKFGNGVIGTPRTLIFAAGIGERTDDFAHGYEHGLIGAITPVDDDHDDDDGGGHY
jgi:uncharacterized protein (TIGR03118 family)